MRQKSSLVLGLILFFALSSAQALTCQEVFANGVVTQVSSEAPGTKLIQSAAPVPGWYAKAAEIPTKNLDRIYFEAATYLGGRVILGGSDLTEILIGSGKKTATDEMNILVEDAIWKSIEKKLQGENSDPAIEPELARLFGSYSNQIISSNENGHKSVNVLMTMQSKTPFGLYVADQNTSLNIGELNRELSIYAGNEAAGKPLAASRPVLMLPLKSDYLIEIENGPQGEKARVYFRNDEARVRYLNRTLAFPSEDQVYPDWHLRVHRNTLNHVLAYNLIIAARGLKAGWKLSSRTQSQLATWIRYFNRTKATNKLSFIPNMGEDYWALQGLTQADFQTTIDWILADPNK